MIRAPLLTAALAAVLLAPAVARGQTPAVLALREDAAPALSLLARPARLQVTDVTLETALTRLSETSGVVVAFSPSLIGGQERRVSCDCVRDSLAEALEHLLRTTTFGYSEMNGQVVLAPRADPGARRPGRSARVHLASFTQLDLLVRPVAELVTGLLPLPDGFVAGRVVESGTGRPVVGAQVVAVGAERGTITDEEGTFRIEGLSGTDVTLRVQSIGYRTVTRMVSVGDAAIHIALDVSAVSLDALVVTGYVAETELRKVDAPVTIVTARELEASPVQKVEELFRGTVPGASAWETGPNDYYSFVTIRGANSMFANYTKVYIDGIQVANPAYLATIDKNSVERVEVTRGPGASTLYGSDAGGGVIQIFTKKGRPEPELSVSVAAGPVSSKWVEGTPWQRELQAQFSSGAEGITYNIGGTYRNEDPYVPENYDEMYMMHGGMRAKSGPLSAEFTVRFSSRDFGNPLNPIFAAKGYANWSKPMNQRFTNTQQTLGASLRYETRPWWQHNLIVGFDQNEIANYGTAPRHTSPRDTLMYNNSGYSQVPSVRYNTTLEWPRTGAFRSVFTAGAEASVHRSNGYIANVNFVKGSGAASTNLFRDEWSNYGYFAQWKPELFDRLFLTLGVRVEDNEFFGEEYGVDVSPRFGATTNFRLGGATLKPRFSYGRGIHPPNRYYRDGAVQTWAITLPNPEIGPETQAGWDAGFDVYLLDDALRLEVTRYDQTAADLIQYVELGRNENNVRLSQFQNTGEVGNTGYEFGLQYARGSLDLQGSVAFRSSEVLKLNEGYTGALEVGDEMLEIPSPVGGATVTYRFEQLAGHGRGGSVSLELSHLGEWTALDYQGLYAYYYGGEQYKGSQRAYWTTYEPVTKLNLAAEYSVSPSLRPYLQVRNLTNSYAFEKNNITTTFGRSVLFGVRYNHTPGSER